MKLRATNLLMTGVTGTAMAGILVAGVAVCANDDNVQRMLSQQPVAAKIHSIAGSSPHKTAKKNVLYSGTTTSSYFWDDGSGVAGDTGMPAGGKPMQKGLFASPSWPMHTKVKVSYHGRTVTGFVGDRGPGEPSHRGVMLDLDTHTFRYLVDGGKPKDNYNTGTGKGHLEGVKYEILKWGEGKGVKGEPEPYGDGS